jgi:hypothetical protein
LNDVIQDLTDVERDVLETLGTMKDIGIDLEMQKGKNYGMEKKDELSGESGDILMMRCR